MSWSDNDIDYYFCLFLNKGMAFAFSYVFSIVLISMMWKDEREWNIETKWISIKRHKAFTLTCNPESAVSSKWSWQYVFDQRETSRISFCSNSIGIHSKYLSFVSIIKVYINLTIIWTNNDVYFCLLLHNGMAFGFSHV